MDIIVLLGNENDDMGNLSPIAKSRCDLAVQLLQENENLLVLPTGAFGTHFNLTEKPHGLYLTEYLIARGISRDRILPHTDSSNTLEDALCARKVVLDSNATRVVVVTSDFHMRRVQYIFGRVFQGLEVEFREAESPIDNSALRKFHKGETQRLKKLQSEWVDVPLFYERQPFPSEIYNNADREQKHYDSVSLALVTGIVIVFGYSYSFLRGLDITKLQVGVRALYFVFPAFFILILLAMYERSAQAARTARRIMRSIELSFGQPGFSSIYPRQGFLRNLLSRISLRGAVLLMVAVMMLLLGGVVILGTP